MESHIYQLALTPALDLTPDDFIAAWHDDEQASENAEANLAPSTSKGFDAALVNTIILSVTTGMASNALYDIIKRILSKKTPHKHTHIREVIKPNGTKILVVDIEEN